MEDWLNIYQKQFQRMIWHILGKNQVWTSELPFKTTTENGQSRKSVSFGLLTAETTKKIDNQSSWNL